MCIWKMDGCIEEQVICLLIGLEKTKEFIVTTDLEKDGTPKKR